MMTTKGMNKRFKIELNFEADNMGGDELEEMYVDATVDEAIVMLEKDLAAVFEHWSTVTWKIKSIEVSE